MWLFTRYGFYSIACANKPDGSLDTQTVMVRARRIAHLRSLQKRFPALAAGEILTWPKRDYRYRSRNGRTLRTRPRNTRACPEGTMCGYSTMYGA
jgi:hypothetical protein